MKQFWKNLPRPFTCLAPLDGVSDFVFRQIIAEVGKPDVMFTEFMMTDGFVSSGKKRVMERLLLEEVQKPVIAQIWGTKPDHFFRTAKEIKEMGFAGIDINMGCPDRTVVRDGACSALINNMPLAKEIIKAVREGAGDLPVSVKTRIGFEKPQIDEWISFLLEQKLDALTVHLRTVRELSDVPAHWEMMPTIKQMRDSMSSETILIGNGDILSLAEIQEKYEAYHIDGFMVGRGIFANPWMFNKDKDVANITITERIQLFAHHVDLYDTRWGKEKNFANLKKFAKTYISNFQGSSKMREELMRSKSMEELKEILQGYSELYNTMC